MRAGAREHRVWRARPLNRVGPEQEEYFEGKTWVGVALGPAAIPNIPVPRKEPLGKEISP